MTETITFTAPLWRWNGASGASWHFVTITGEAAEILSATALMRKLEGLGRGFGSLQVSAQVGDCAWQTSVFPQNDPTAGQTWMLPVKAAVRKAEGLTEGDPVSAELRF